MHTYTNANTPIQICKCPSILYCLIVLSEVTTEPQIHHLLRNAVWNHTNDELRCLTWPLD